MVFSKSTPLSSEAKSSLSTIGTISPQTNRNKQRTLSFISAISLGLLSLIAIPQRVNAAEKISLVYGPFKCHLSVEALKVYAETGEITPEFKPYAKFLNQQSLLQLRHWLQKVFDRDVVSIHKYTRSDRGEQLLQEIGTVVSTHSERNGFYAIRGALIEAAAGSNEWTILDVIQEFPTENMQINTKELFKLKSFWQESNIVQNK